MRPLLTVGASSWTAMPGWASTAPRSRPAGPRRRRRPDPRGRGPATRRRTDTFRRSPASGPALSRGDQDGRRRRPPGHRQAGEGGRDAKGGAVQLAWGPGYLPAQVERNRAG